MMDELMSDPAQPFTGNNQELKGSQKPGGWNTKKFREECDTARSRMSDSLFDIKRYADPLLPREPNAMHSSVAAQGFSPDVEKRLQDLIAEIKSSK